MGASGDLTPLSYIAAVLAGEREVWFAGEVMPAAQALERCGLEPLTLRPKEALALMNGTSMMLGLACLAFQRAQRLARLSSALSAMASDVMRGNPSHFDERLFAVKPHPGSALCARLDPRGSRIRRRRRRGGGRARPGPLFDPLRAPRDRRAAGCAGAVPPDAGDRDQQRQRQPDRRRRRATRSCTAATSTAATSPSRWTGSRRRSPTWPTCSIGRWRCCATR